MYQSLEERVKNHVFICFGVSVGLLSIYDGNCFQREPMATTSDVDCPSKESDGFDHSPSCCWGEGIKTDTRKTQMTGRCESCGGETLLAACLGWHGVV